MKWLAASLVAVIAICLCGCVLRGKPQQVAAASPPPPKPVVAPPPPPPPRALSIPQTHVDLPTPQPLTSEALNTTEPAEETPAAPRPSPRPPRRTPSQAAAPQRNDASPPPAPVGPTTPTEPERPSIQEIVPAGEQARLQAEAANRKRTIQQRLQELQPRRLSRKQQEVVKNIQSLVKASDEAEGRGDMNTAAELAQRGLLLVQELLGVR